ncbi:hypothetical protein HY029_01715 [Candidatus Gottesmanbacteria bacterium]|nr:hypothetical protein [Candidatus Gottesmanbacteria bacterium]
MNAFFVRNLIKGKITEVIFEEMFRESEEFTVIPIGYEHTIPELAQYQHHVQIKKVLDNIRSAPDFVLINKNKTEVFLVEVKYRETLLKTELLKIATEISEHWNPCWLFVASKTGFYFSPCHTIINAQGNIEVLSKSWVKDEIQEEYFKILPEFIK